MGNCCSAGIPYYQHPIPAKFTTYRGAGMIFENGRVILCGYEPTKRYPALYGIGGKREASDANYRETAAREVLEELFGFQKPSREILHRVLVVPPRGEEIVGGYVMIRYGFDDLTAMMLTLRNLQSPYYRRMPVTVSELVLKRDAPCTVDTPCIAGSNASSHTMRGVETLHLCLLPMVTPAPQVSADLAGDIQRLLTERSDKV